MSKKLVIIFVTLFAYASAYAQVVVYTVVYTNQVTGSGTAGSYVAKAWLALDTESSEIATITWYTLAGQKSYETADSELAIRKVRGVGARYTVIAGAAIDLDVDGNAWVVYAKGKNTNLVVAAGQTVSFPNKLSGIIRDIRDLEDGTSVISEAPIFLTFSSTITRNANNSEQSVFDVIESRREALEAAGYTDPNGEPF